MKNIITTFTMCSLLFCASMTDAQQIILSECIGTNENEYARDIQSTADGGFILIGYTKTPTGMISTTNHGAKDYYIAKLYGDGSMQWQFNYGGTSDDEAFGVTELPSHEFVVIGSSMSSDGDVSDHIGGSDIWCIRISPAGELVWSKSYGTEDDDFAADVCYKNPNRILIGGTVSGTGQNVENVIGSTDFWMAEMDLNGNVLWENSYGASGKEKLTDMYLLPDNEVYLAGTSYSSGANVFDGEAYVIKADANGEELWDLTISSDSENGIGSVGRICINEDGGITLGFQSSTEDDNYNCNALGAFLFAEISADGEIEDVKCYGGSGMDKSAAVCMTEDGSTWILGTTSSSDGDVSDPLGYNDEETNMWIAQSDDEGNLSWNASLGGTKTELAVAMCIQDGSKIYLLGTTNSNDGLVEGQHTEEGETFDTWVVVIDALASGLQDLINLNSKLTPNPANENIWVNSEIFGGVAEMRIINHLGQIIRDEKLFSERSNLDVSNLAPGLYTVVVSSGNVSESHKLVIQ